MEPSNAKNRIKSHPKNSDAGSIEHVSQRLLLWARREGGGLARVEYASEFSRQRVLQLLGAAGIKYSNIELPIGKTATEVIAFLLESLAKVLEQTSEAKTSEAETFESVVSISGFAAAFQGHEALADSLRVLNFNRESLTAFPLRQIWWMTPVLLDTSLHAMPDMHGWFNPQIKLTQVISQGGESAAERTTAKRTDGTPPSNIDDARQRSQRLLAELEKARAGGAAEIDLATTYLLPALESIANVGARKELKTLTAQYEEILKHFYEENISEVLSRLAEKETDAEETSVQDPLALVRSLDTLVNVFYEQGLYGEAERFCVQSLNLKKRELGDHNPSTATSLNNLAALYRAQGRYSEAEPLYLQALDIYKVALGDRHPDTARSLNNLALLYDSQGRYSEAEPLYLQALEIKKAELGDHHPDTARSLNNLAGLYDSQGRYSEAEPLYLQALDIRKAELGDHHPDTAQSLNNLALLYDSQGRYSEAEPLYLQALEIKKAELGDRHPNTASSLNNLALLYDSQGRYSEAEPLYLQALDIYKAELGDHHPDTAQSLNNLAALYRAQGRYSEAAPLYLQALEIRQAELGDHHPDTAQSLNNLAWLYFDTNRLSQAAEAMSQALSIRKSQLGPEHPYTLNSKQGLEAIQKAIEEAT